MADEESATPPAAAEAAPKTPNAMIPAIAGSAVMGLLILGGLSYLMKAQAQEIRGAVAQAAQGGGEGGHGGGHGEHGGDAAKSGYFDLDEFLVNLANPGGGRYLRTTLSLRFRNEATREAVKKDQPKIRDGIIEILTSRGTQELNTREGKTKLKEDILGMLTKMLPEAGFDGVYLVSFTLQ